MKPKIILVKQAPTISNPIIQNGFRDRQAVESWAVKHGYATVYYMEARQRIYADRSQRMVEQARKLKGDSKALVKATIDAVSAL